MISKENVLYRLRLDGIRFSPPWLLEVRWAVVVGSVDDWGAENLHASQIHHRAWDYQVDPLESARHEEAGDGQRPYAG
jgi:hypothetical protein